jgi:hypothetical protein
MLSGESNTVQLNNCSIRLLYLYKFQIMQQDDEIRCREIHNEIKEHMMGGRRSTHGSDEKFTESVMRKPEVKI